MKKLAIISSHPIQYNAPLFSMLSQEPGLEIKVFYTLSQATKGIQDVEFGKTIQWDIPLLEGYAYTFVPNIAKKPGTKHFWGLQNPSLISEVENWEPDAVLVYGWSFKSHLAAMRYFKGKIPVLFRGDSTLLDEQRGMRRMARRVLLRWVYSHVDKALFVGENNKVYFKAFGLKEKQLVFVPHVVDNNRFAEWDEACERRLFQRKVEIGLEAAKHTFLFIGKFIEKKNPFLLLDAFLKADFDASVHLVFVGNGMLEEEIKNKFGNMASIHFLPFQNQSHMPEVYKLGNTLVLPSKGPGETWGLVVNEAMAAGLAAVVSNKVGCAPDMVQEGKNGYIFDSESVDSLVYALQKAVGLSAVSIEQSNAQVLQRHSLKAVTKQIVSLLNSKQ